LQHKTKTAKTLENIVAIYVSNIYNIQIKDDCNIHLETNETF